MRILLIDDSREFMGSLRRMLAGEIPDLETTEYDPDQQGQPPESFDWSIYDLLVLSHDIEDFEDGLGWLRKFRDATGFPPTLFLASEPDVYVAATAIKLGAGDFLLKEDLSRRRLIGAVRETLHRGRRGSGRVQGPAPEPGETLATADGAQMSETLGPAELTVLSPAASAGDEWIAARRGFEFSRLIGQGAMSKAYLAKRVADGELVVVKCVKRELLHEGRIRERFAQEAEIARSVSGEHVVRMYDYDLGDDHGLISMEFFPGGDLAQRMEHPISPREALSLAGEIAAGIRDLWHARVVHRDLKPGNLMFRDDGRLVIADFGISKRVGEDLALTMDGEMVGTPYYMSPEQIQARDVDTRSDLYALGVILYEMLCGTKPYEHDSLSALIYAHVHCDPSPLPDALAAVQPLLDRLLAKSPADRFPEAGAVLEAMESLAIPAQHG